MIIWFAVPRKVCTAILVCIVNVEVLLAENIDIPDSWRSLRREIVSRTIYHRCDIHVDYVW